MVAFVEQAKRRFSDAFDFERTHRHGFNGDGDRVAGVVGFGHEDTDEDTTARAAACAMGDASRGVVDAAENAFHQLAING
eukprot:4581541-Pleurochrysis_carterae.AAC.1